MGRESLARGHTGPRGRPITGETTRRQPVSPGVARRQKEPAAMRFAAIPRSRSALLITALSLSLLFVAPVTSGASMSGSQGYASDQLLVKFRPSAGRAGVARALMAAHVSDKSVIRDLGVHVVHVSPSRLETALSSLRHSPNVLYADRA